MGASSSNDASNNSASPQAAPKPVRDNPPQPVYSVAKDSTPLQNVFRKFVYGIDDAKLNPPSAMSPSLPSPSAPEAKSSMPPNLPSLSPSPPEAKSSMPPNLPSASEVKSPMSSRNDSKSPPSKAAHLGFQVPFQALFRSDPSSTELKLLGPNTKLFDHNSYEWKPNVMFSFSLPSETQNA